MLGGRAEYAADESSQNNQDIHDRCSHNSQVFVCCDCCVAIKTTSTLPVCQGARLVFIAKTYHVYVHPFRLGSIDVYGIELEKKYDQLSTTSTIKNVPDQ
jgi:hypothetical protein